MKISWLSGDCHLVAKVWFTYSHRWGHISVPPIHPGTSIVFVTLIVTLLICHRPRITLIINISYNYEKYLLKILLRIRCFDSAATTLPSWITFAMHEGFPMRYCMTLYLKGLQKYDRSKLKLLNSLDKSRTFNFDLLYFW